MLPLRYVRVFITRWPTYGWCCLVHLGLGLPSAPVPAPDSRHSSCQPVAQPVKVHNLIILRVTSHGQTRSIHCACLSVQ